MFIPESVTSINFYGYEKPTKIYFKQFFFNSGTQHWISVQNLIIKGIYTLCLCNWNPQHSSLNLQANEYIDFSFSVMESLEENPRILNISISEFKQVKSLKDLSLEALEFLSLLKRFILKHSYLTKYDFLKRSSMRMYLMSPYGNEIPSCKHGKTASSIC